MANQLLHKIWLVVLWSHLYQFQLSLNINLLQQLQQSHLTNHLELKEYPDQIMD